MNLETCWYKGICVNDCTNSCVRYNCMKSLFEHSQLPESQWVTPNLKCSESDLEAFKFLHDIENNIDDWVDKGENIYIFSHTCGNGKTSWSIKLMKAYFNSIWHRSGFDCHGLFIHVPTFLYNCKRSISQKVTGFDELCKKLNEVELVVWDDLPCSTFTGYEHQIILQYIDNRINSGLSNIFTGNCDKSECTQLIGERLTSRIFGCSDIVEFVEGDKRGYHG